MHRIILAAALSATPLVAMAQGAGKDVYTLGELQVTARSHAGEALGGAVISGEDLKTFNRQTIDQALALVPGANASNSGGSRNERVIYIRGFDRFQSTLSVDGVRVYLPADNRLDFARFLTGDLSEVQVSKGYVSVMDGPGGLGGAINLVTIKPIQPFEAEAQASLYLDRKFKDEAHLLTGRVGGRTGDFYWQASGSYLDRDHFTLSKNFQSVVPTLEDGGERGNSASEDWRINLKAGWQPNDTDEYSINYTRSEGEKNAPYSVRDTANTRFWSWPYWDTDSLAFLSRTQLSENLTLRTRLYRTSFDNLLSSFDTAAQTTQTLPRAFNSYYKDHATGGNVQLDLALGGASTLKAAFYARRDVHKERQDGFTRIPAVGNPSINAPYSEPWQTNNEWTYSLAAEYTTALTDSVELVVGGAYDWTNLVEANDVNVGVTGTTMANSVITYTPVYYPLRNNDAWNGQAALLWRLNDATRLHASVSNRVRFPTLFERFSSRMGAAIPNPNVRQERATNYELGFEATPAAGLKLTGAVYYSDLKDALIQIPVVVPGFGNVNQTRNVAKGDYYGFEAGAEASLGETLDLGGNVTYIHRKLKDANNAVVQLTGVPDWKAFAYVNWRPLPKLTLRPNVEYADQRGTVTTTAPLTYYRTGSYMLVNLSADYDITEKVRVTLGVQNLGDQDYQLTDGFPEAGRTFQASVRARF